MTLEELVHINYDKLNEGDLEIWEYIYNHKQECAGLTIEQCAAQCNVSRTTILRFAKKLSLSGYSEFKYLLKMECAAVNSEPAVDTGIDLSQLTQSFSQLLEDLQTRDYSSFHRMMDAAQRIYLVPSGHTQLVAVMQLQDLLTVYTDKLVVVADSRSRRVAMLNTVQPEDLVIFVTQSGKAELLVEAARELKWRHVPMISLTQFESNPLAQLADEAIFYPIRMYEGIGENGYTNIGALYIVIEFYMANYINHVNQIER